MVSLKSYPLCFSSLFLNFSIKFNSDEESKAKNIPLYKEKQYFGQSIGIPRSLLKNNSLQVYDFFESCLRVITPSTIESKRVKSDDSLKKINFAPDLSLHICKTRSLFSLDSRSMNKAIVSHVSIIIIGDFTSINWLVIRSKRDSGSSNLASSNLYSCLDSLLRVNFVIQG